MPCASLWMYSVTKNTTGMKRPRITARNAANDTSRPIVPPSEEGGIIASAWEWRKLRLRKRRLREGRNCVSVAILARNCGTAAAAAMW